MAWLLKTAMVSLLHSNVVYKLSCYFNKNTSVNAGWQRYGSGNTAELIVKALIRAFKQNEVIV